MTALARKYDAEVVVIAPVYMDSSSNREAGLKISEYRSALKETAEQAHIPYLEVKELTEKGYPDNEKLFGEPIHPNYLGQKLLAERLSKFLDEERVIK